MLDAMTVGQAAAVTGLSAKAIRLYEARGLTGAAERTESGYRRYGPADIALLTFIRQARSLGLSLGEIGQIIDLQRRGRQPCTVVMDLLDHRIAEIDRSLADLRALRAVLSRVRAEAEAATRNGQEAIVCRIIEAAAAPCGAKRAT